MSGVIGDMEGKIGMARSEAEAWFARLMAPDCGADEHRAFERWRAATPSNATAWAATEALWQRLDGLEEDEVIAAYAQAALEPEPPALADWADAVEQRRAQAAPRRRARRRLPALPAALAASVLLAALGAWLLSPLWSAGDPRHYRSDAASRSITLEDGSQVRMDVSTQLQARIGRRARGIELQRGRAIFDVAHDASRPFSVDTGHGVVVALGTRFQIDREGADVVVTLIEGAVSVEGAGDGRLVLAPGEQARRSASHPGWSKREVDPATVVSWVDGFHVFSATPLDEAVREVNRYSPTAIRLQDPSLRALVLSGNFRTGDAEAIARVLPAVLPVEVETHPDAIVLRHR